MLLANCMDLENVLGDYECYIVSLITQLHAVNLNVFVNDDYRKCRAI